MYGTCGGIIEVKNMFDTVTRPIAMLWLKVLSAQTFLLAIQALGLVSSNEEAIMVEGRSTKMTSLCKLWWKGDQQR